MMLLLAAQLILCVRCVCDVRLCLECSRCRFARPSRRVGFGRCMFRCIFELFKNLRLLQSMAQYRPQAEAGDAEAQFRLGHYLQVGGQGVTKDEKESFKWSRKAAEQGHALAQYNLALSYANGEGVAKDEKQAVQWFSKAAEQGYAVAYVELGSCYYNGSGVDKDEKKAVQCYRNAA